MRNALYQVRAFKLGFLLARILPRRMLLHIGRQIASVCYQREATVQATLIENLRVVTGRADLALAAENVRHFGEMLADYFYCVGRSPEAASSLLREWRGLEHFEGARARGKGAVLVTAHLGNWELGGALLALCGFPITVVTLEEPTSELTRWRGCFRERFGIKTITVGPGHEFAFVEMLQTLRRNEILAMLVDRPYAGTGTPVRFFDRDSEFSSAAAHLWQHTGAAVIPAFVLRQTDHQYISFADAPLPFAPASDSRIALALNTQTLASHFETVIRQHPEQWFNYVPIWADRNASAAR